MCVCVIIVTAPLYTNICNRVITLKIYRRARYKRKGYNVMAAQTSLFSFTVKITMIYHLVFYRARGCITYLELNKKIEYIVRLQRTHLIGENKIYFHHHKIIHIYNIHCRMHKAIARPAQKKTHEYVSVVCNSSLNSIYLSLSLSKKKIQPQQALCAP